jgi:hypothetical protein
LGTRFHRCNGKADLRPSILAGCVIACVPLMTRREHQQPSPRSRLRILVRYACVVFGLLVMACVFVRSIVLPAVFLFAAAAAASPSLNPDVRQDTIASTICSPGYTSLVRPASVYTNGVKLKLVRNAGQDEAAMADYELDHIVPLALGGHPRALDNLQLQP